MKSLKLWIGIVLLLSILPMNVWAGSGNTICGHSIGPCANSPVQGNFLFNTQTTGGAGAAVATTIAAAAGTRTHIYSVEGRCNTAAQTSGITITDGGTTIWSTVGTEVLAATNFVRNWSPGLTGTTNSAVVITLAACAGGGTGTLIVQADRY